MKEILEKPTSIDVGNNIETHKSRQQQVYLPVKKIPRGHKWYEWNLTKLELDLAKFTKTQVPFDKEEEKTNVIPLRVGIIDKNGKKYIIQKVGCVYFSALNETNALKHIAKTFGLKDLKEKK